MIAKVILGTMTNARKLVSIAERISCDVELCSGRYVVNAKSMLGVLSMPEFEYGELHIHTDELLLLEKGDWNDQGCYIPNINDGGKMAQYDYHMLVRVRPSCEDILRNNRILYGSELPEEVIDILLNQSWEYCMPRYISRDELIYLIQNNFVIKAGSYFNKTKMDADNYYVKAYDMHELPEIINGLS